MGGLFALQGVLQNTLSFLKEQLLSGREAGVQRGKKLEEALGQVAPPVKAGRRLVYLEPDRRRILC
jgi:hypothetical protein